MLQKRFRNLFEKLIKLLSPTQVLRSSMSTSTHIEQELAALGIELKQYQMPVMDKPKTYFEEFPYHLNTQLELIQLENGTKSMPYQVPQNYFNQHENRISEAVQLPEILMSGIKEMPYHVPFNYFNQFPSAIASQIHALNGRLFIARHTFLKPLSIAATILLFMGIAFKGLFITPGTQGIQTTEQKLALLPDDEIQRYIQYHSAEIDQSLSLETVDEAYLDLSTLENDVLNETFQHISDEELAAFVL
jgi:hypothetical protein